MDEDFNLLDVLIQVALPTTCPHTDFVLDKSMYVCRLCGAAERASDGQTYTSHKMYKRVAKNTSIAQSLEQKGFDKQIIITADQIYNLIIDENAKRTGNRSSIICACVFQAFKILGHPVDYTTIYEKYDIKKRSALKGLKIVNAEIAKRKVLSFREAVSAPIVPESFILSYMEELKAPEAAVQEVLDIYKQIKGYNELNMSRPQSIAAGVIFYWLRKKGMTEAMKIIEQKANLSQLTINKKAKLVAQQIEEQNLQAVFKSPQTDEEKV